MLTGYQRRQLRHIEIGLQQSDPRLARSLAEHRLCRPRRWQWLMARGNRIVAAWMGAAGQMYHLWPEQRWY